MEEDVFITMWEIGWFTGPFYVSPLPNVSNWNDTTEGDTEIRRGYGKETEEQGDGVIG
jgi:hypothetical protein